MDYKDYYKTLGVERDASADDIKKAYRKLVRKYHPDVSKVKDADKRTKEINEAYAVLGEPEKRAAYDAPGSGAHAGQPVERPPEWGARYEFGNGGSDDFFSDLFAHVGKRSRASGFAARGQDLRATLTIDLIEAYRGATRTVSFGVPQRVAHGRMAMQECTVDVRIPAGVAHGQLLRVAGHGHPGVGGAPPGDLVLEIRLRPDARYRVEGRNVTGSVAVAPWEAALGAHIDVPTPTGTVQVSVPAGSQTGRKLRLKGKGLPGEPAGDLYLVLEVVLPPATRARARELYQAMASELAFNPRAGRRVGA